MRSGNKRWGMGLYSILVAALPLLATYASGIPGFSMADAALAGCCVLAVLGEYRRIHDFTVRPVPVILALYLILLFNILTALVQPEPELANMFIRTIRYFFYLFVVAFCSRRMLDLELCRKAVRVIALLGTVYIFLQYALYTGLGLVLRGYLPSLKLYVEGYAATDYETLYQTMYRPTSFFLEPAHYARYGALAVALFLFDGEKLGTRSVLGAMFLSLGILLSTSAQGYVLVAVVWGLCLLTRLQALETPTLRGLFFGLGLAMPLLALGLLELPFVRETLDRALNIDFSNLANENTALGARLGGFGAWMDLPLLHQFIGMGFGVVPEVGWLSSAAYFLYGSGGLVLVLYLIYGILCVARTRGTARVVGVLFLLLLFSDDSFYSYLCVLFISLACLSSRETGREGT